MAGILFLVAHSSWRHLPSNAHRAAVDCASARDGALSRPVCGSDALSAAREGPRATRVAFELSFLGR